jgi:hypothetical protein
MLVLQLVPLLREVVKVSRSQHGVHSMQPASQVQSIVIWYNNQSKLYDSSLRGLLERTFLGNQPTWQLPRYKVLQDARLKISCSKVQHSHV